ncbi:MAG: energy-coupling factor transporter ATPase [Clostridia bacterium]|nr:energy-coupling factor transporter ATPase [Clostridia bacterium]
MFLEVENLSYTYMPETAFAKTAISDVSFCAEKGEFIGLIGHSGSGKSTLIQHLNGLLKPTGGSVVIDGENLNDKNVKLKNIRFKVGLVFQYPEAQLFEETVYKDIAFGPSNMGLSKEETDFRVHEAAALVGIKEELLSKSPFELSGGQKRRVAIAGVVAMKPEILILDEPTAGLDPRGRNSILKRIGELHKTTGMTVILVSHSMEDIANNVNRILVMNKGKLVMDGSREEIFSHVDYLNEIGLDVPQVTTVVNKLIKRGVKIPENIFTVEKACEEIKKYVESGGIKC